MIYRLTERYGKIDIIWAASDGMALGVLDAIDSGLSHLDGSQVVVGGMDWTKEAILSIKQEKLTASVGGHIMQVAWSFVKIFDHHHGVNVFKKSANTKTYDLELINKNNIETYLPLASDVDWNKVDFRQYSIFLNEKLKTYQFNISAVIEKIKQ